MSSGTAVSTEVRPPLAVPSDEDIAGIRKAGAAMVAYQREVNEIEKTIEGLQWGTVTARSLTPHTRYALAEFCRITRANPMTHIDVLGGKPYLNSTYWSDLVNQHPLFHHYEQRDLSLSVETALRERAHGLRNVAQDLQGEDRARRVAKALDLEEEADEIAAARSRWSPPPNMTVVIETTIWRFMNQAPMAAIGRGEVEEFEKYLIHVSECNWAGGKEKDPVGNANPGLTARTRSFRRAAVKAFSAWTSQYDEQIKKAEYAIEAEFTVIEDERSQARALASGPQAVATGSGEPEAASTEGARPLPVHGEALEARGSAGPYGEEAAVEAEVVTPPKKEKKAPADDEKDEANRARRQLFATLKDSGIEGDPARKEWAQKNNLPASTKDWGPEHYARAMDLLVSPTRKWVEEWAGLFDKDVEDMSLTVLGKRQPETLKDWKEMKVAIQAGKFTEEEG